MNQKKSWFNVGLAVVVIGGLFFGQVAPTFAASDAIKPPDDDDDRVERLENIYEREQLALETLAWRLEVGAEMADKAQAWIDLLGGHGVDVSGLVDALAVFEGGLAEAQSHYDAAAAILDAHEGFNGSGKVMDIEAAINTVRSAAEELRATARTLHEANSTFRASVREWREAHRPPAWEEG